MDNNALVNDVTSFNYSNNYNVRHILHFGEASELDIRVICYFAYSMALLRFRPGARSYF